MLISLPDNNEKGAVYGSPVNRPVKLMDANERVTSCIQLPPKR